MASNVLFDDNFKMIGYRDKKENRDYYTQEYIEKLKEREKVLREACKTLRKYYEFLSASLGELTDSEELLGIFEPMSEKYAFEQLEQIKNDEVREAIEALEKVEGK